MKNLKQLSRECMQELDALGIEYGVITDFTVNTRAKKRWGQCRKRYGVFSINISSRILEDNVTDESTKTTILHEILHTVDGCFNHGYEWQKQAEKVNRAYGYNIKRCSSAEEKGVEPIVTEKVVKYQFVCEDCGQVISRQKKSDFVKNYKQYRCGICKGEFKQVM